MSAPSGGWFVTKQPQFVEEAIFGTLPTNPDMNWLGAIESWDPRADINVNNKVDGRDFAIIAKNFGKQDP